MDIDGTICRTESNKYYQSQPIPERIEKINNLYRQGHTIVYWTARGANSGCDWSELTLQQLNEWGCLYHRLEMGKPPYDIWIDDLAINSEDFFK